MTQETVRRHLKFFLEYRILRVLGSGKDKCYICAEKNIFTNFQLQYWEILALSLLCSEQVQNQETPLLNHALSALVKLRQTIPESVRKRLDSNDWTKFIISPKELSTTENPCTFYEMTYQARENKCPIHIKYESFSERDIIDTIIYPYSMVYYRRAWYVIGLSEKHHQVRTFHVGRIHHLDILTDTKYTVPYGWSLDKYFGNAWGIIRGAKDYHVIIRFLPLVAKNVISTKWHKTQEAFWNKDGSLIFHVTVSGLQEIIWWIFGYADQAEVLHPEELRAMMQEKLKKMNQIYMTPPEIT
ncbi:MAG: WYL domain-containing protein [Planctomycetia bacterium]|nr:WYL domain-containing protein [Planctomycetia bacterium]